MACAPTGSFGTVYLATDHKSGHRIATKMLKRSVLDDMNKQARFAQMEADFDEKEKAAKKVGHQPALSSLHPNASSGN